MSERLYSSQEGGRSVSMSRVTTWEMSLPAAAEYGVRGPDRSTDGECSRAQTGVDQIDNKSKMD